MSTAAGYDLHTHSTFSDGTTSVSEIAAAVAAANLQGFALTDHDTVAGWADARAAASVVGVDFVPGIELTTKYADLSLHLLGYGMDPARNGFAEQVAELRDWRQMRAQKMVELLAADFPIDWEQLQQSAGEAIGRPHIADELIRLGIVVDREAAFAEILNEKSKYYVPNKYLDTRDAVQLVTGAGGVAVLAHPAAKRHSTVISAAQLRELIDLGLRGIELRHPENDPGNLERVTAAAANTSLLVTGSSDFHGAGKPNRIGQEFTAAAVVTALRAEMAVPN